MPSGRNGGGHGAGFALMPESFLTRDAHDDFGPGVMSQG